MRKNLTFGIWKFKLVPNKLTLTERRYIHIRKAGFSDASDIAKNTGLPEQDIIDMKNHLFFEQ